jgi:hypothetical protein
MPTEQELATETKMRGLTDKMNKPERLKMLELMLEKSSPEEIIDAIKLTKISREVNQIGREILDF